MNINKPLDELNKHNLLKYTNPEDIFIHYMDKPIFDKAFSSPFRKDSNPSFIVRKKGYYFKDFATGEYGDCYSFVKKLYQIDFNEALKQIAYDMGLSHNFVIPDTSSIRKTKKIKVENIKSGKSLSGSFKLEVKSRAWNQNDLDYWEEYGINKKSLRDGSIYPIVNYFINGILYKAEEYAYVYVERKDGITTLKVYQPFSNFRKWINNNNFTIWELWTKLPDFGDELIITSSRKDALSITENLGIPATSFQAESIMPRKHVTEDLFKRFRHVYLLYDNDQGKEKNWGQENALKLVKTFPWLENRVIPDQYLCKDFSDLVYKYGRVEATKILKNLL